MENIKEIASIVFVGVGILAYIITTVLAIRRKKANGEKVSAEDALAEIANNVLKLVMVAESAFPQGGGGTEKLKSVLTATKSLCKNAGIIYDKNYWVDFVEKAVDLINIKKQSQKTDNQDDLPLE